MPDIDPRVLACAEAVRSLGIISPTGLRVERGVHVAPLTDDQCATVARAVIDTWLQQAATAGMVESSKVRPMSPDNPVYESMKKMTGQEPVVASTASHVRSVYTAMCAKAREEIKGGS